MGSFGGLIAPGHDLSTDPYQSVEVLGPPLVSGDVVAVPVAYIYPGGVFTGFDVLVTAHVEGGLLVGGAASFLGSAGSPAADPAAFQAAWDAASSAFNAGDVDGVLATMDPFVVFWPDVTDPDTVHRGPTEVGAFLAESFSFTVEATGDPVFSGPFAVWPSRHTATASGGAVEGLYVFWVRDGKTALQAHAQSVA